MMQNEFEERFLRPIELNQKNIDDAKSNFDNVSNVWIADKDHGFIKATLARSISDKQVAVKIQDGKEIVIDSSATFPCDSSRNDLVEDMSSMTELNNATVLNVLSHRYASNYIYTYSGLFLVAINPYRDLAIYGEKAICWYRNRGKLDSPPHIYAIADSAYKSMMETKKDQSILITGESGAGKTENTKRVIQYLVSISGRNQIENSSREEIHNQTDNYHLTNGTSQDLHANGITIKTVTGSTFRDNQREERKRLGLKGNNGKILEEKILHSDPILESFGNAQTLKNNNSSRFGKFIRLEFEENGLIHSAKIERYLLEKSRVTNRSIHERSFHIFYQFLAGASVDQKENLGIIGNVSDYSILNYSNSTIEGIDDAKEFEKLIDSMNILGIEQREQDEIFSVIAVILLLGNLKFENDQNDQAICTSPSNEISKIASILGVSMDDFMNSLLNPPIKPGKEQSINQGRSSSQVIDSIQAHIKTLYERMFGRLVDLINRKIEGEEKNSRILNHSQNNHNNSNLKALASTSCLCTIGVLDIAGFEIFEKNSFEQLCINFTNEKLQQFFNHHMFIKEQEDYRKEQVEWNFIDFGLDLQPTIDLIEKSNPIGILACLDEDCVMPKSSDRSFCEKITSLWKGKSNKFETLRFGDGFSINHYAGKVDYTIDGWLEKNKDPLNENIAKLFASQSTNKFIVQLYKDYLGSDEQIYQSNRGSKKGVFRSVGQKHKESLALLIQQLNQTEPHFVRCLIPNQRKKSSHLDSNLILDQLKCNGVLEGIRISRLGYPNRVPFRDFARFYEILLGTKLNDKQDINVINNFEKGDRGKCLEILSHLNLKEREDYQIGNTLVLLRSGVQSRIDQLRDEQLSNALRLIQAHCRGIIARSQRDQTIKRSKAIATLQRNVKIHLKLQEFPWYKLVQLIRPLVRVTRTEELIDELNGEIERLKHDKDHQLNALREDLEKERNNLSEAEMKRKDLERECQGFELKIKNFEENALDLRDQKMALEMEIMKQREQTAKSMENQREEFEEIISNKQKLVEELEGRICNFNQLVQSLNSQLEEKEYMRLRFEKSENLLKSRLQELQENLEEMKNFKKETDSKTRQLESEKRRLEEMIEDKSLEEERIRKMQVEHEASLRNQRQRHENDMEERIGEYEAIIKKYQREIGNLNSSLESERQHINSLGDQLKKYELGADSLASQLEVQQRNNQIWQKKKERFEDQIKELSRQIEESSEREDIVQGQLIQTRDQVRMLKIKMGELEEQVISFEKQKKILESGIACHHDQIRQLEQIKATGDQRISFLEGKIISLDNSILEYQEQQLIQADRLYTSEQAQKLLQYELSTHVKQIEELSKTKNDLEKQCKELQKQLLDMLPSLDSSSSDHRHHDGDWIRKGSNSITSILNQIETESQDRQKLIKENKKQERQIRDFSDQISSKNHELGQLESSISKLEIKIRKMQTNIDSLESTNNDLEISKRRSEREVNLYQERSEKLEQDLEHLKQRIKPQKIIN